MLMKEQDVVPDFLDGFEMTSESTSEKASSPSTLIFFTSTIKGDLLSCCLELYS